MRRMVGGAWVLLTCVIDAESAAFTIFRDEPVRVLEAERKRECFIV